MRVAPLTVRHRLDDESRACTPHHFLAANAAVGRGVDLRGYFVRSLLDNFE
jgi:beta-glucosidase